MKKMIITSLLFITFNGISQIDSSLQNLYLTDTTKAHELDEVIMTATRTQRQLSSLPLPAQIIHEKEIKAINSVRLSNVLNEQTGLITVSDFGGGEGLQVQGLDSQYTLILIDGVPLIGRLAGTLDISRISVGNIKQIEIVKGASSSLYGSEAMGGVVNIITNKAGIGFSSLLDYRYATNNTHDVNADIGYGTEKLSINANANFYKTDGYDLDKSTTINTVDPFSNYTLGTKLVYRFSDATKLLLMGRAFHQKQDIQPTEELRGETEINEWNTQMKFQHEFSSKWEGYFEFYATRYKADEFLENELGEVEGESDFNQLLVRPEIRTIFNPNDRSTFIAGIGMNHETLERTDFSMDPVFDSEYIYIQYDGNPSERINLILGARFDHHSKYESQFSPKAALRYEFSEKLALKGSVGYGFKAPDFRQLYFDFSNSTVGYTILGYNVVTTRIPEMVEQGQISRIVVPFSEYEEELKPENSVAINFGGSYTPFQGLVINANLFRNNIQDLIDTRVIANKTNGQNVFSYYNTHRVFTQGLEIDMSYKVSNEIRLSAGYQLLFAKDKEAIEEFENGNVYARDPDTNITFQLQKDDYFGLYNRSRHMANVKIFYNNLDWKLDTNLRLTYRSKYGLFDTNGNNYLDKYDDFVSGYALCNWAVNKDLGKKFRLGIGIDNIFDYTDPQYISSISGRITYAKINIKL